VFLESPQHKFKPVYGHWRGQTICQVSRLRCTDQTFGSKKCGILRAVVSTQTVPECLGVFWNLPSTNLSCFVAIGDGQTICQVPAFVARIRPLDQESVFCGLSYRPKLVPECLGVFPESPQHKFKPVLWPLRRATICQVSRLRCTDQTFGSKKVVFCREVVFTQTATSYVWICSWRLFPHHFLPVFVPLASGTACQLFQLGCTYPHLWIN